MNRFRSHLIAMAFASLGFLSFCLPGCGTSPSPKVYTLSPMAAPVQTSAPSSRGSEILLGVGPFQIPDYLDQAQIVTRVGKNQLSIAEFDLWGGSIKEDMNRVLLENLSILLKPARISVVLWKSYLPCVLRVPVTIVRFDAVRGELVSLKARWTVLGKDVKSFEAVRETVITKPVKGSDTVDVVAAMSDALEALSKEIASDVKRASTQEGMTKASGE